jgi:hypothetical protein
MSAMTMPLGIWLGSHKTHSSLRRGETPSEKTKRMMKKMSLGCATQGFGVSLIMRRVRRVACGPHVRPHALILMMHGLFLYKVVLNLLFYYFIYLFLFIFVFFYLKYI